MKLVDSEQFQIRKYIKEIDDEKNYDCDMEVIEEGNLEKALNVQKKTPGEKNHRKQYMR